MRLRLFDRIRRLVHFRRSPAETAGVSGAQGRHRRSRRRGPATAAGSQSFPGGPGSPGGSDAARGHAPASGEWSSPGGPPGELAHTASPWPGGSPISEAPVAPGMSVAPGGPAGPWADPRVSGTRRDAGASAAASGAARARIREAPQDAAAVGLGEATRPVPAPGPQTRRYETAEPGLAQSSEATLSDTRAEELARVAAGVPRQPDGTGRSSWRAGGRPRTPGCPSRLRIPGNGRWPGTAAGTAARSRPSCGGNGTRRRRRPAHWWRPSTGWPNFPSGSRKGWPTASTRSSSAPAAFLNSMT